MWFIDVILAVLLVQVDVHDVILFLFVAFCCQSNNVILVVIDMRDHRVIVLGFDMMDDDDD